jgi:hypothetical protein
MMKSLSLPFESILSKLSRYSADMSWHGVSFILSSLGSIVKIIIVDLQDTIGIFVCMVEIHG